MPYRICKTFEIESGHLLSKHPDNCRFPHGHSRKVEVVLESDELDQNDMVCDLKLIKSAMAKALGRFDHALCVNTADPHHAFLKEAYGDRVIDFMDTDPTSEVMAKTIYDQIKSDLAVYASNPEQVRYSLSGTVRIAKVRIGETSSSWAEYSE